MTNVDQLADSIIAEEGLDKPQQEETQDTGGASDTDESQNDESQNDDTQATDENQEGEKGDADDTSADDGEETEDPSATESDEDKSTDAKDDSPSASEIVERGKSFVGRLQQEGLNPYDEQGNMKSFDAVVPPGEFLASRLEPVQVTDKDGKTHEFLLLSDVEKKFPEGFEAKNNIEQLKFERAIKKNEDNFDKAIDDYKTIETEYGKEVQQTSAAKQSNESIRSEYMAMAKEGLVPKPIAATDPAFAESDAVKELNTLLDFMKKENVERAKKGYQPITSLYDAKQKMDSDPKKKEKADKAKTIDQQRKSTASLSRSPASKGDEKKKPEQFNGSLANFAEHLIAEEGLN